MIKFVVLAVLALATAKMTSFANAEDSPMQGSWNWIEKTDELTDVKMSGAFLKSSNMPLDLLGIQKTAEFVATCSPGTLPIVTVRWPDFVEFSNGENTTGVQWKLDSGAIQSEVWNADHDSAFLGGQSAIDFLVKASGASKLAFRITGKQGPQNAVFDLTGITQQSRI